MKKILFSILAAGLIAPNAFAGSIDYLSNQSADYIRTFSRNAADDYADAAFYNPAGTVFLKDGLSLQVNHQTLFKDYSDTYAGKEYKTDAATPSLPSLWAVYKKENISGFLGFSAIAGGGQVNYRDGIPMMAQNAPKVAYKIQQIANAYGIPTTVGASFSNGKLYANQFYPAMTLGGTYALNNSVSVSAGARAVYMIRKYRGEATYAVTGAAALGITSYKLQACADETAFGVGGIFGVDIRPVEKLNIGLRFDTPVMLNAKTEVEGTKDFGGLFKDGEKRRKDLPAVIAGGASYGLGGFMFSTSADVFLIGLSDQGKDTGSFYDNGYDDNFDSFGYEVSASVEYAIVPDFLKVSAGYMYDHVGGNSKTYGDFDFSLDSHSFGTGAKVAFMDNLEGTLSGARVFYKNGHNEIGTEYKKAVYMFAVGLDYRFQ